jgi:hypothetical protein
MRFEQPLVEGPLTKITVVSDSELVVFIGKLITNKFSVDLKSLKSLSKDTMKS